MSNFFKSIDFTFIIIMITSILSCEKEKGILPVVNTIDVWNISQRKAMASVEVISSGGVPILARGICWNKTGSPVLADNHTTESGDLGTFVSTLNGLELATFYHVRAYATNKYGTGYGNEITFESAPIQTAVVTTDPVSSVRSASAVSGGFVNSTGGASITAKGICWSTATGPTLEDPHTMDGTGDEHYMSQLTGLSGNTTYFVRAYTTNIAGTAFGNELSFKTFSDSAAVVLFNPILFNPQLTYGTIMDYDWNTYKTIQIGTQIWMAENLKATSFNNGEQIANLSEEAIWTDYPLDAFCWYDNDIAFKTNYGSLYNWHAIKTGKLCPTGWHVPSSEDFNSLITYLGGENGADGKLKETGTVHWLSPSTAANNESGFSALPGGYLSSGEFMSFRIAGYWWSSSENDSESASYMLLEYNNGTAGVEPAGLKTTGMSVRCIKD